MDSLFLKKLFCWLLLTFGIVGGALANYAPNSHWEVSSPVANAGPFGSAMAAAAAGCTAAGRSGPVVRTPWYGCDQGPGTFQCVNANPAFDCFGQISEVESCSAGDTLVSHVCTNSCGTEGTVASTGLVDFGTVSSGAALICDSSCEKQFTGGMESRAIVGGIWHYFGRGSLTRTGRTCTGGVNAAAAAGGVLPPITCASGQSVGSINGNLQCFNTGTGAPINPNTGQTPPPMVVVVNPTGGTGGGPKTTTTNPDGSTTVQDCNTTGTCTTTTTGRDPLKDECADPVKAKSPLCGGSSFTGSCGAFSATGDAVEVAIAKEIYERNCAFFDGTSTEKTLYTAIKVGSDPLAGSIPSPTSPVDVSMSAPISQTAFIGQHDLTDESISLGGTGAYARGTLVIPWSKLNFWLRLLGGIVVAFTLVAAVGIVFKT